MGSRVEVWRRVLDETVDDDGEELMGKAGMITIALRDNVDERCEIGRENGVRCRASSVKKTPMEARPLGVHSSMSRKSRATTAC